MDYIRQFKEWQHYFEGADVTDIKTVESRNDLRTFIAAMLSFYPWWPGWRAPEPASSN